MPRAYFRTLPDLYERKAFGTDTHPPYPAAAVACFIGVLCFAEQQPERGRFKSQRLVKALLEGPRGEGTAIARMIPFLIAQGDLIERPDGSLYVDGWDELQEGDWQAAERVQRHRARNAAVTVATVTDVTVATVNTPSELGRLAVSGRRLADSGGGDVTPRPLTPRQKTHAWLTDHGAATPTGWVNTTLNELVKVYGADRLCAIWDAAPDGTRTSRQYVQLAERTLAPPGRNGVSAGGHTRSAKEVDDAFR